MFFSKWILNLFAYVFFSIASRLFPDTLLGIIVNLIPHMASDSH